MTATLIRNKKIIRKRKPNINHKAHARLYFSEMLSKLGENDLPDYGHIRYRGDLYGGVILIIKSEIIDLIKVTDSLCIAQFPSPDNKSVGIIWLSKYQTDLILLNQFTYLILSLNNRYLDEISNKWIIPFRVAKPEEMPNNFQFSSLNNIEVKNGQKINR